jgi:hypothetical protein
MTKNIHAVPSLGADRLGRAVTARVLQLELARVAELARAGGDEELLAGLRTLIGPVRERANSESDWAHR